MARLKLVTQKLLESLPADPLIFRIHSCIMLVTFYAFWDLRMLKVHNTPRAVVFDHKETSQILLQL